MGYNTAILILNDGLDQLKKHPEDFVEGINQHMHRGGEFGVGCHANVVDVMRTEHADVFRLYGSHGNLMLELSPWSRRLEELYTDKKNAFRRDVVIDYVKRAKEQIKTLEKKMKEWDEQV